MTSSKKNHWSKIPGVREATAKKISDDRKRRKGTIACAWKGGRRLNEQGYIEVYCPEHPKAVHGRYVLEHRLVWEEAHGVIPEGYIIHHKNEIKIDNRLENLMLLSRSAHNSMHKTKR